MCRLVTNIVVSYDTFFTLFVCLLLLFLGGTHYESVVINDINNNGYLECLTSTGPKRLHIL